MLKDMAHNVYYVEHHKNGWAVERPKSKKPSRVVDTKSEAVEIAHDLADEGIVHVEGPHGGFVKCRCPICRKVT
jgi:uncharacterized protein YdaT